MAYGERRACSGKKGGDGGVGQWRRCRGKNRGVELAPVREAKMLDGEVRLLQNVLQRVLKLLPQITPPLSLDHRVTG